MNHSCFPEQCPESAGIAVRFAQELLSGISRNQCPLYARITVRNGQESVSGLVKNMQARLNENGHKIIDIYREIKKLGYTGGKTQGYTNIKLIKENYEIETTGFKDTPQPKIRYVKPLSSRILAKYIGFNLVDITDLHERFYLQTLLDNMIELRIVRKLVQIFKTMLSSGCGNIRRWIDFVKRSKYKLAGLKTFARGLLRDIEAVENGINMPWSNGAVEGHVNRIKSIKRQMYGRASFELLRKKVILSQSG